MIRFKCITNVNNEVLIFKRYAETVEQVKKELLEFIKEKYEADAQILEVITDKVYPENEEQSDTSKQETTEEKIK